jgi:hypothetical protein
MLKDLVCLGTISVSSLFLQVTPEAVGGWEKVGVIGILIAAIMILLYEKRTAQKELLNKIEQLHSDLIETKIQLTTTKNEIEELQKVNSYALDRLWKEREKKE